VAITPDGRHVVSGSYDKTLRVWDLATGQTKMTLRGHTSDVEAVAVTPDGRHVVSVSNDETLRVWDLTARLVVVIWSIPSSAVRFAPRPAATVDLAAPSHVVASGVLRSALVSSLVRNSTGLKL
jgi:WD40 repeat protein